MRKLIVELKSKMTNEDIQAAARARSATLTPARVVPDVEVEKLGSNLNFEAGTEVNAQSNHGKESITTAEIIGTNTDLKKKDALMTNAWNNDSGFSIEFTGIDHAINKTSSSRD